MAWEKSRWRANLQSFETGHPKALAIVVIALMLGGLCSFLLARYFLRNAGDWKIPIAFAIVATSNAAIIAVLMAMPSDQVVKKPMLPRAVLPLAAISAVAIPVFFFFPVAESEGICDVRSITAGPFFRASGGRFCRDSLFSDLSTFKYICPGLRSLPRNFRRLILCTSPRQLPELVPGLTPGTTDFTLVDVLRQFETTRRDVRWRENSSRIRSICRQSRFGFSPDGSIASP